MVEIAIIFIFLYSSARLQESRIKYNPPVFENIQSSKNLGKLYRTLVLHNRSIRAVSLICLGFLSYFVFFSEASIAIKILAGVFIVFFLLSYGMSVSWNYMIKKIK